MAYEYLDTISLAGLPAEDRFPAWRSIVGRKARNAKTFEIHCWAEEEDWFRFDLDYGSEKESDWAHGKIVAGEVTEDFVKMLINQPKPEDTELYDKMTPFFSIFFDNGFSSEHYGTEMHVWST